MKPLHKVSKEELPVLVEWTAKYLPDAYKIHNTLLNIVSGQWHAITFYTLGWPDILAVGEGPADSSECQVCADFFNTVRHTCVYAPEEAHVEELLLRPEFLDWNKPILFHAVAKSCADVVERISKATGTKFSDRYDFTLLAAFPGDEVPVRLPPDGLDLRPLDSRQHADYVTSTWPWRRKNTNAYIAHIIDTFPSVGIFDRNNGECVALELGTEFDFAGLLYVREDYRGRGLASCVVSHMARKYFQLDKPILSTVGHNNSLSQDIHRKLGLKAIGQLSWLVHSMTSEKVLHLQER